MTCTVYVYPDGENYSEPPQLCETCDEELTIEYDEPFAHCKCGTQEWHK
jgi:hypothetical protein